MLSAAAMNVGQDAAPPKSSWGRTSVGAAAGVIASTLAVPRDLNCKGVGTWQISAMDFTGCPASDGLPSIALEVLAPLKKWKELLGALSLDEFFSDLPAPPMLPRKCPGEAAPREKLLLCAAEAASANCTGALPKCPVSRLLASAFASSRMDCIFSGSGETHGSGALCWSPPATSMSKAQGLEGPGRAMLTPVNTMLASMSHADFFANDQMGEGIAVAADWSGARMRSETGCSSVGDASP
mmetsp:Transcript_1911/g.4984  ORF Transcript_1911/g.4984 Transcript_1911/m.4984 type:complete len:240 (-) Transcript_1911:2242-2961(-)